MASRETNSKERQELLNLLEALVIYSNKIKTSAEDIGRLLESSRIEAQKAIEKARS